ncbi:hypothetical protein BJ508DRAFT_336225 [Ascobolus immersus RN42]|uniref:Uncharacterized protein n=1 Tax=Ascobolus immersus RN42 TaxID=1160509 RepID=A0A3N4HDE6_ASCIM|nr:hypothetical protein BJ508DRAFT_336225 [Ascobolus immersus RN42]
MSISRGGRGRHESELEADKRAQEGRETTTSVSSSLPNKLRPRRETDAIRPTNGLRMGETEEETDTDKRAPTERETEKTDKRALIEGVVRCQKADKRAPIEGESDARRPTNELQTGGE